MLHPEVFQPGWLKAKQDALKVQDLELLERTVHAFALLHALAESGLNFVFKGGTCMLLLPTGFSRLSIDIDIHTSEPRERTVQRLNGIGRLTPFKNMRQQDRTHDNPPQRSHYEFIYDSAIVTEERKILLDVVEDECPLTDIQKLAATPSFLKAETEVWVTVPTLEALLGDKLTAFAPETIGVPFERSGISMAMQVVKQAHDVHRLSQFATDMPAFAKAYNQVYGVQNRYRGNKWALTQVAQDSIKHALAGRDLVFIKKGATGIAEKLRAGKQSLGSHLLGATTYIDVDFQSAMATVAALALWGALDEPSILTSPLHLSQEEKDELSKVDIHCQNPSLFKKLFPQAHFLWVWVDQNIKRLK